MSGSTLNVPVTVTGLHGRPISTAAPAAGNGLLFDGTTWNYGGVIPSTPNAPVAGDVLVYDGSAWNPAQLAARNFIDNSGFTVNQRGYTSGTALAANAYGFDRWKAGGSGCTLTFTATPASTPVTIGSGSLIQVVEGESLLTGQYTLSWAGTAVCSVGALTNVASPVQVGAAAGSDLIITFSGGTLGQVQLQLGTVATPWQPQPTQVELARCQRFFSGTYNWMLGGWGQAGIGNIFMFFFPVIMRATPSVNFQITAQNNLGYNDPAVSQITVAGFAAGGGVGATGGYVASGVYNAMADL
jgi:hypothetical protein